jgi:hypothetical protein
VHNRSAPSPRYQNCDVTLTRRYTVVISAQQTLPLPRTLFQPAITGAHWDPQYLCELCNESMMKVEPSSALFLGGSLLAWNPAISHVLVSGGPNDARSSLFWLTRPVGASGT